MSDASVLKINNRQITYDLSDLKDYSEAELENEFHEKNKKPDQLKIMGTGTVSSSGKVSTNKAGTNKDTTQKRTAKKTQENKNSINKGASSSSSAKKSAGSKDSESKNTKNKENVNKSSAKKVNTNKDSKNKTTSKAGNQKRGNGKSEGSGKGNNKENNQGINKEKSKGKKALQITLVIFLVLIGGVYIGGMVYFNNHFFPNTTINGHDFSMQSDLEAETFLRNQIQGFELTLFEHNGESETLSGDAIDLQYLENADITRFLSEQNLLAWPFAFFNEVERDTEFQIDFNQEALLSEINKLRVTSQEQIMPSNAFPVFDGRRFVIEPEYLGTAINQSGLRNAIFEALGTLQTELDLEALGLYFEPRYTTESPNVIAATEQLNTYLDTSVSFTVGSTITLDYSEIINWLTVDENYQVTLDEDAVEVWVAELAERVNTQGTQRTITTPFGRTATVSGGDYGWRIHQANTLEALLESIRIGEVDTREPFYHINGRAAVHGPQDWGDTFLQVDLTAQHMWYFVNGEVVLDTPVVTGAPEPSRVTPTGVDFILEMDRDRVLRGPREAVSGEYAWESPVSYWMRVTWSGIGFHDATWQSSFGGNRYVTHGSRGCINMPLDQAARLYGMLSVFTPVIIHD